MEPSDEGTISAATVNEIKQFVCNDPVICFLLLSKATRVVLSIIDEKP